jgi:Ohr subfamily peroxiredoxin
MKGPVLHEQGIFSIRSNHSVLEQLMSQSPAVIEKSLYTAVATATAGRSGRVQTEDGQLELNLSVPRALGGSGAPGTNPEQLFAAGYSASFGSAVAHVAQLQKIRTGPVSITAHVTIGSIGHGFGLAVGLVADIPELPREQALALLRAAQEVCPYSNAMRGNVLVDLRLA